VSDLGRTLSCCRRKGRPGMSDHVERPAAAVAVPGVGLRRALALGGLVERDLLAVDWAATPLGPMETWPQSLCTSVRIALSSRFPMWLAWGPELTFFCNDAYRRDTLGIKYPWALGRPAGEVWAEIWGDIHPRIERVIEDGTATWDEALMLFLERSGYVEETYHTFSYSPLTDDDGTVAGMLCVVSEETERVIGERRMRTLRDLGSGIAGTRSESDLGAAAGRALSSNPQCLPFTLLFLDTDRPDDPLVLAATSGVLAGHPVTDPARWPLADLDGRPVVVDDLAERFGDLPAGSWGVAPAQALLVPLVPSRGGEPHGVLVAALNRYRLLDEGYRGFVELIAGQLAAAVAGARAYDEERRRAEDLAELDRAKTAFFTNVSHELRTPLTLMLGPAEDALADRVRPLAPAQRERVEMMHRNAQRLLKLVNTLLDFSRLQSGEAQTRLEPTDLAAYTTDLALTFQDAVARARLRLDVDCPPLQAPVLVDREMWAKIVLNLVSNALKFTFDGGITVALCERAGTVELEVTDTGIGIDAVEQARLFDRFHRVAGARGRSHEGSGIGLALVAELASLLGGTTDVASEPGHGSRFTVTLPLRTAPEETAGPAPDAGPVADGFLAEAVRWLEPDDVERGGIPSDGVEPHGEAEGGRPGGDRPDGSRHDLLVVDDNADMREYLARLLCDRYEVRTARDGLEALRVARERPPDLVLTDVMMPGLDGLSLVRELRADPVTALVPVVVLSARAGPEAATEGLEAGADDYLIKPFAPAELRARVRANLELDRTRRAGEELERSRALLDQAQRLARVGSWELDLATGAITSSEEFRRQLGLSAEDLREGGLEQQLLARVHPDDADRFRQALNDAVRGERLDVEVRMAGVDGAMRTYRTLGELERDGEGRPARLRGSNQDVTDQRQAEQALAVATATREAAAREHRIADELQRSLLPDHTFTPEHLQIATYYRAGVEGTQVGGDWFDVIELGADRTALVIGDVMGRGVRAAAVMGQLRAAVRAYARLDIPPADLLELIDSLVRDLGDDQIVTCLYAVYDPGDRTLTYASAGHLPPLLAVGGRAGRRLTQAAGSPLGSGPLALVEERVQLPVGSTLVLYTDGLVEHRDRDIDAGIDTLASLLADPAPPLELLPAALVSALVPGEPDDDIAVLAAWVSGAAPPMDTADRFVPAQERAVRDARRFVGDTVERWGLPGSTADDLVLMVSELVTNAVVHGRPPIELRLRHTGSHVVVEVLDGATFLPRRLRPTPDDEHGRGLQLVALLADRWGTRATSDGKSVWCVVEVPTPG